MVPTVHEDRSETDQTSESRAVPDPDLVMQVDLTRVAMRMDICGAPRGVCNVLHEVATAGHVEDLRSAANPQHREPPVPGPTDERKLERVAILVGTRSAMHGLARVPVAGMDIVATGE